MHAELSPALQAIMESSISQHNVELYASNLNGIPILARAGSKDPTISPIHSRRMIKLVEQFTELV
jgi:hypothetical protein